MTMYLYSVDGYVSSRPSRRLRHSAPCNRGGAGVGSWGWNKALAGWLTFFVTLCTAILVFLAVTEVLQAGTGRSSSALAGIIRSWNIGVDGLSAVFLMIVALLATHASLFSIAYMRRYQANGTRFYPYFLLFLAAIYGLLTTRDVVWSFLLFWQLMVVSGYALIRFENRKPESGRAANRYLFLMEVAVGLVTLGTLL